MSLLESREKLLKEMYGVSTPVEVKNIQLNQFCMVVDDLDNAKKEILELVPSTEVVASCKNEQEIARLSKKAIEKAELTLFILKEAIESLKGEEI